VQPYSGQKEHPAGPNASQPQLLPSLELQLQLQVALQMLPSVHWTTMQMRQVLDDSFPSFWEDWSQRW
jgi:hypothetical protein